MSAPPLPIDIVITWVDGEDQKWQNSRQEAQKAGDEDYDQVHNHPARYRDIGLLPFVLRSINLYAPWANHIYLVTPGQTPLWLNVRHPKITLINQADIIPPEFGQTFKSTTVEWNLHRIPELSEHFIYFNDDMLLNQPVTPQDFFIKGKPKVPALYRPLQPGYFTSMILPAFNIINSHFGQRKAAKTSPQKFYNPLKGRAYLENILYQKLSYIPGYFFPHTALPLTQSLLKEIWQAEPDALTETCSRPFRDNKDVIIWLAMYWAIETNQFEPQDISFSRNFTADKISLLEASLASESCKSLCINDTEYVQLTPELLQQIQQLLLQKFPVPCSFELSV